MRRMTGKTPTGPVLLGRWSQPAAQINAGLVPPEPYPLEKILFCASCGQQFIGTHRTGDTDRRPTPAEEFNAAFPDGTRVAGTHLTSTRDAGGTYFLGPDDCPDGDEQAEDPRVYGTFCDCRPGPLPAFRVELQVYAETHLHAFDTPEPVVPGLTHAHYALLAIRFFTRVEVGPTVDHMTFTARI